MGATETPDHAAERVQLGICQVLSSQAGVRPAIYHGPDGGFNDVMYQGIETRVIVLACWARAASIRMVIL
ncbi:MAG: hypothetical protein NT029_12985 [Armatimonadetes bacterium]|nr:hypothetical protein [Armatimonadota bacterium]